MADDQDKDLQKPEGEILYTGNRVPWVLRFAYVAFIIWLIYYLSQNLIPDLVMWLKRL